jgi:hypothetical protein
MATVKGTEFYTIVDKNGNVKIICIKGLIAFANKLGQILIKSGETGVASKGKAPEKYKTDISDLPTWANEGDDGKTLEFEFEDADGNKKVIKINYDNE